MTTLQQADAEAAAAAVAPRVTLADIEGAIASRYHFTASEAIDALNASAPTSRYGYSLPSPAPIPEPLRLLSICLLVMRNGFTIIGKSAPASAENFNAELGRKLAYEDAVRQLWAFLGYNLRQKLYEAADESST